MKHILLGGVSHLPFFAPDGVGAGGGAAAAGGTTTAALAPAGATGGAASSAAPAGAASGGGEAAAGAAAAAPAAAASVLGGAKTPEELANAAETPEEKTAREAAAAEAEAKRVRDEKIAKETPEEKTAREKEEAGVAKTAALKSYEGLKLPDGMPAEQPAFVDFKDAAATAGLAPDVAQKLIDTVAPKLQEAINAPYEAWVNTLQTWVEDCKKDKEFGGKDYEKNLGFAALAIDKLGGDDAPKLREVLNFTGVGNNPELVRWMVRAGKMLAEGRPVAGNAAPGSEKSLAQRIYPEMTPTA